MPYSKGRITFVVQNETHAQNFALVIDELLQLGVPKQRINCISLDKVTGLGAARHLREVEVLDLPVRHDINFYLSSGIRRLIWLLRHYRAIRSLAGDTRVVVMGNDGAIQRILLDGVRRNKGRSILVLDGLLFPWASKLSLDFLKSRAKKHLFSAASRLGVSWLSPSHVGHSPLDEIFVMDSYVKEVLEAQIRREVKVVTLPRIAALYAGAQAKQRSGAMNVLYVSSAFLWHAREDLDRKQWKDLRDINAYAAAHPDFRFRIRVHPREPRERYLEYPWGGNVELTFKETPLIDDLIWSAVVVTAMSTVAYEAKQLGLPVLIYTGNFTLPSDSLFNCDAYYVKSDQLAQIEKMQGTREGAAPGGIELDGAGRLASSILGFYGNGA